MKEGKILSAVSERLGINELNEMQREMLARANEKSDLILLSPTGSGKTLAFLIPMLKALKEPNSRVQAVIIAPSRELVLQIYNIVQPIAVGHKVTCCYGGHNVLDEKQSLSVVPSIIVSTPGRLLDHIERQHIDVSSTRLLVLDEFDKSLELGFHDEMKKIVRNMPNVSRRYLTSATMIDEMPDFLKINEPLYVNFLGGDNKPRNRMKVVQAKSSDKDKLNALKNLLLSLPQKKTIVFANYRDAVDRIYQYLIKNNISAGVYHGALEQIDREKAVAMFNNGSYMVMVTTDLGSRGLDIDEVAHIVHYHIPVSKETYTHRNGRTARVNAEGEVYVITSEADNIPEYMQFDDECSTDAAPANTSIVAPMATLYFMAGKKEKISRGDIVGFIANKGGIDAKQIGAIDLKDHFALVAIPKKDAEAVLARLQKEKIKNKKVRISLAHC